MLWYIYFFWLAKMCFNRIFDGVSNWMESWATEDNVTLNCVSHDTLHAMKNILKWRNNVRQQEPPPPAVCAITTLLCLEQRGEHKTSSFLSTLSKQNKAAIGELNPPAVPCALSVKYAISPSFHPSSLCSHKLSTYYWVEMLGAEALHIGVIGGLSKGQH